MPNFFQNCSFRKAEILQFFNFANVHHRHLLFLKSPISLADGVQRIKTHEHVKFWQNRLISCKDINIFQFFQMAGDAILDYQICEISLSDSVWKAQTHYRGKFRQNRLYCCGDIAIFRIFKMAVAAILDFLK